MNNDGVGLPVPLGHLSLSGELISSTTLLVFPSKPIKVFTPAKVQGREPTTKLASLPTQILPDSLIEATINSPKRAPLYHLPSHLENIKSRSLGMSTGTQTLSVSHFGIDINRRILPASELLIWDGLVVHAQAHLFGPALQNETWYPRKDIVAKIQTVFIDRETRMNVALHGI